MVPGKWCQQGCLIGYKMAQVRQGKARTYLAGGRAGMVCLGWVWPGDACSWVEGGGGGCYSITSFIIILLSL